MLCIAMNFLAFFHALVDSVIMAGLWCRLRAPPPPPPPPPNTHTKKKKEGKGKKEEEEGRKTESAWQVPQ